MNAIAVTPAEARHVGSGPEDSIGGRSAAPGPGATRSRKTPALLRLCATVILIACTAEVASKFPEPGGSYIYARVVFGRFAGIPVKIIWTVIGLAPAALFLTGMLMWWKRVLKPWLGRKEYASSQLHEVDAGRSENSVQAG